MISGSYSGNSSVVGVGGRPWLQKIAATLVAISLTVASVQAFRVVEEQYSYGYSDARAVAQEVLEGLDIRIIRVISSTFLWLAQVQTLIRLFPRHMEKVMIKWVGFALIVLDITFAILDNFLVNTNHTRPRMYADAIPALDYLFELSLNLLYAAWVIFYALSKHRFAFFHPKMRSICLVALLSLVSVLIPVVFFVTDIAKPDTSGWGAYIRWVGSAAASVVVWEWVERIEALERDENKDGILGREIFDGDEMLEVTPSEEVDWPREPHGGHDRGGGTGLSSGWAGMIGLSHRPLRTRVGFQRGPRKWNSRRHRQDGTRAGSGQRRNSSQPGPPPTVVTPISRGDTASADSTVYNVHYHPVSSPTPPVAMPQMDEEKQEEAHNLPVIGERVDYGSDLPQQTVPPTDERWRSLFQRFRHRRTSPPPEVASAQAEEPNQHQRDSVSLAEGDSEGRGQSRIGTLLPHANRRPGSSSHDNTNALPVTVIPARPRGQQVWSPQRSRDTSLLDSGRQSHTRQVNHDSSARVIMPQMRIAAPWTESNEGTNIGHELRYDPHTAALMEPDDRPDDQGSSNEVVDTVEQMSITTDDTQQTSCQG